MKLRESIGLFAMIVSVAIAEVPADRVQSPPVRSLCAGADREIDMQQFREMRSRVGAASLTDAQTSEIQEVLEESARSCKLTERPTDLDSVAGLFVVFGNNLRAEGKNQQALQVYGQAERLYKKRGAPNVFWIEALQGAANAAHAVGLDESSRNYASSQTRLIRSWVATRRIGAGLLVDSLRFEADLLQTMGQRNEARRLRDEAESLKASLERVE
jgi:hypothetical protein